MRVPVATKLLEVVWHCSEFAVVHSTKCGFPFARRSRHLRLCRGRPRGAALPNPCSRGLSRRDRALKVKRAVRYPFLDFSSLEKRKAACEAELEVNRKFAPQLY